MPGSFPSISASARSWLGDRSRPVSAADLIADNPSSVEFVRENRTTQVTSTLSAQTVRLELASLSPNERTARGGNANVTAQRLVLLGYKDHPTEDDTNIQRGDRFAYDGRYFRVLSVEPTMQYFVQAICEVNDG